MGSWQICSNCYCVYCVMLFQSKVYLIKWPAIRYQSCPVMNFNEWHKTRGQSLHFPIILELILCLTWLYSGEPNLPGLNQKQHTVEHLFLIEVITAKLFLAVVKHTILGRCLGSWAFFCKEHEKLLILILWVNRVQVCCRLRLSLEVHRMFCVWPKTELVLALLCIKYLLLLLTNHI